jgi:hypothetical protein
MAPPLFASLALVLLGHAAYSSYEFAHHAKLTQKELPFPHDIYLEVGVVIGLFLIHTLLVYPKTQHKAKISLVDSGRLIKPSTTLHSITMNTALVEDEIRKASGFYGVENRVNYTDWFSKRAEFDQWRAEEQSKSDSKQ